MRNHLYGAVAVVLLAGCGTTVTQSSSVAQKAHATSTGLTTSITSTQAGVSVHTHHGVDAITGLRVAGLCFESPVVVLLGHAAPFEPLHKTGIAAIDRTKPPRHAILRTACSNGRFELNKRQLGVRWGRGPLRAWPAGRRSAAVGVAIKSVGME